MWSPLLYIRMEQNARKIMTIDELIRMIPVGAKVLVDGVPLEECTVEITQNKYDAYKGSPPVKVCSFIKSVTVNFIPKDHYEA